MPYPSPIAEYLTHLEHRGAAARTLHEYGRTLGLVADWLAPIELLAATRADLLAWRSSLTGVAGSTVVGYASPVRGLYRWAYLEGFIERDPAAGMPLPRQRRRLPRPIATADLQHAIAMAPPRIRPWLVLAAYAGLRACEIAHLRREDIANTARPPMIIVSELMAKGGHERMVPMSAYVWGELVSAGLPRRGWVFGRRDGRPGPNSAKNISHTANAYLHSLDITGTLHCLRHWFATAALDASGGNLRVVQELMGHGSPATTAGYAAIRNSDAVAAVDGIQPARRLRAM